MLRGLTIECACYETLEVEGLPDELMNEDYKPVEVVCEQCGMRHRVILRMEILGKEKASK